MIFRFGTYELDEEAGELRRGGEPGRDPAEALRAAAASCCASASASSRRRALRAALAGRRGDAELADARRLRGAPRDRRHAPRRDPAERRAARLSLRGRRASRSMRRPRAGRRPGPRREAARRPSSAARRSSRRLREAFGEARAGRGGVAAGDGPARHRQDAARRARSPRSAPAAARSVLVGPRARGRGRARPLALGAGAAPAAGRRPRRRGAGARSPAPRRSSWTCCPSSRPGAAADAATRRAPGAESLPVLRRRRARARVAARRRPLVVVLEDLQWAGPASLRLLEHLALRGRGRAAPRRGDACATEPARERALERTPRAAAPAAALRARSRCAASRAARWRRCSSRALGRPAPPDLTSELFARTEGVPLFLREALRLLAERGELRHPGARAALGGDAARARRST